MNAVEVIDLVKTYGPVRAVDGISFTVAAGEIVGLLGPNGAGKTSTLECLLGLRSPDSGTIRIDGIDAVSESSKARGRVGAVLQSTALQDKITPREAVRLFAGFYGIDRKPNDLLERFGLVDKADATFDSLSGGQRQRLALALAFVHEPRVLVLDEPTAGLDPASRRSLHEQIQSLQKLGCAVLLSTHYIDEAHALCDRVVIVDRGHVVATGTPDELVSGAPAKVIVKTSPVLETSAWSAVGTVHSANDAIQIETADVTRAVVDVVKLVEARGVELIDLQIRRPTLEDVFLKRTGNDFQQ